FERVYRDQLLPFLSALYKFPRIRVAFHCSGVLLSWLERTHFEIFILLRDLVSEDRVQMLSGGFYEPLLPIIAPHDRTGQIELLTTYLSEQFEKRPNGCWVSEYVWEQALVSSLYAAGMDHTFLDSGQFALAGIPEEKPCICEDQGRLITVFPVSREIQEALAQRKAAGLFERLWNEGKAEAGTVICVFPEQVERAEGESPDYAWNHFFDELCLCEPFLETVNPTRVISHLKGKLERAYIPASAGREEFSPRKFILENPEARMLYSKTVFAGILVGQIKGDKSRKATAFEQMWKAQSGVLFRRSGKNGSGNAALRAASYSAIADCLCMARETRAAFSPSLMPYDLDMDGRTEWFFREERLDCWVRSKGGGIFSLDYLPKPWNYLNTFADRLAFADRILPTSVDPTCLGPAEVEGERHCAGMYYKAEKVDKVERRLSLSLGPTTGPFGNVKIEKGFHMGEGAVFVDYSLTNSGDGPEEFLFCQEIDLALSGPGPDSARFFAQFADKPDLPLSPEAFGQCGETVTGLTGLKLHDLPNEVVISLAHRYPCPFDLCILPLYTEDPDSGERLFQVFSLMSFLRISLGPGESRGFGLSLEFSH
ncbi:MAG: DUF1926 domain-containing protein, partial [Treponema sp.]|nr:DUF1926 domain-containing protein [Treponema sp.]